MILFYTSLTFSDNLKKSKMAIGTTIAGASGAVYVGKKLIGAPQKTYQDYYQ